MSFRKLALELWFLIYAVALLPSWVCAAFITWYQTHPNFVWVNPVGYARYSRSTLNAIISMILWFVIITAWEHLRA